VNGPAREQLLEVVRLLVDQREAVRVEEVAEGKETVFRLEVAEGDLGKVIGRQGRTARSLRTVLAARSAKGDGEYALEIIES
jgi:predicted RNA-binding protein YlqC (UPF0109 family)